ncbi:MAG TPA: carbohydrate ABC transporter permease [Phycisphaerales bacterium]|nr:carbohydrate ABC transporter permease [Phycisphaerales bacterium]
MSARRPSLPLRLGVHAAVYLAAATMVFPFLWMVLTSLKTDAEALSPEFSLLPESPRWSNYAEAWTSVELGRFCVNSFLVASVTTLLAGAHNTLAGYAFAKLRFGGRRMLFLLTLATMMLPIQVFFVFAYLIADWAGYVDSLQGLIVPFLASAFGIYYMRQAVAGVPDSLLEAGRLDGMSELEMLWRIVRPTVWPAIAALGIFTFVASWNSFFWPLILIDSRDHKTMPLAIAELSAGIYVHSWPVRMAAATILTAPLVLVFLAFQRAFVRGVALTGLKE